MSTEPALYLVQAVTFSGGRISRGSRESVARLAGVPELDATAKVLDLYLFDAGESACINEILRWSSP